jgi:hypothetical protein
MPLPRAIASACILLAGCAALDAPPPRDPVPAVALFAIHDPPERSAVTGIFTFYSWVAETRATVPTMLADALRSQLAERGIGVVEGSAAGTPRTVAEAQEEAGRAGFETPVLFVAIDKWEADDASYPAFVDVAVEATLLAPSGDILWTARRAAGPVATRGSTSLAAAYQRAAQQVAADLVGRWQAS